MRNRLFCLCMLLMMFTAACASGSEIKPITPNQNPDFSSIPSDDFNGMFEMETDYSNIIAAVEYDSYHLDIDRIKSTIQNNSIAKGFYFYQYPLLEYQSESGWVRLSYYPQDYDNDMSHWRVCGIEGNTTDHFSTVLFFYPEYVLEDLIPGLYRLVFFAGDNVIYQEFEFVR